MRAPSPSTQEERQPAAFTAIIAPAARILLAAALRSLPYVFGERGRLHAGWRANHWAPPWLHGHATNVRARRNKIRWELDLRDNVQRNLYYTGRYEPEVQALLRRALSVDGLFVDIGAHIGVHALPLAQYLSRLQGTVVAFEPAPDNVRKLRQTAARAGVSNLILVETALGSTSGTVVLHPNDDYGVHDTGVRSQFGGGIPLYTVPVVAFDDWAVDHHVHRIDVVKIDVEGAELEVLTGMVESLRRFRPRLVIVELLDLNCRAAGIDSSDVRAFFEDIRYAELPGPIEKNAAFVPAEDHS